MKNIINFKELCIKFRMMNKLTSKFGETLTREQLKNVVGGVSQTNCGIKMDGIWRRLQVPEGEGAAKA